MTDNVGPEEAPALIGIGAQSIVDRAKELGLTWTLRPASVINPGTVNNVDILYDGDDVPIGAINLTGVTMTINDRVMAVAVPPGNNVILGLIATASSIGSIQDAATAVSGVLATSSGAEVAIPSGTWSNEKTFVFAPGHVYRATFIGGTINSLGTVQAATLRIRVGAATTTGNQILQWEAWGQAGMAGNAVPFTLLGYVKNVNTRPIYTKLSATIIRIVGAGSYSYFGDGTRPMTLAFEDVGPLDSRPNLASIAANVA
jgi:hypothetical protein